MRGTNCSRESVRSVAGLRGERLCAFYLDSLVRLGSSRARRGHLARPGSSPPTGGLCRTAPSPARRPRSHVQVGCVSAAVLSDLAAARDRPTHLHHTPHIRVERIGEGQYVVPAGSTACCTRRSRDRSCAGCLRLLSGHVGIRIRRHRRLCLRILGATAHKRCQPGAQMSADYHSTSDWCRPSTEISNTCDMTLR